MSSYQKITLVGRLGSDPQMKYLDDGRAVTEFSLAVNEYSRPAKGKKRGSKTTTWFKITCWERLAETAAEHLSKGRQVLVEGKVKNPRPWSDRNGEPRCNLDVVAFDVRFLDGKNDDSFEDDTRKIPTLTLPLPRRPLFKIRPMKRDPILPMKRTIWESKMSRSSPGNDYTNGMVI